jgi:hypothetical protein
MHTHSSYMHMDNAIFDLKASVPATSLYILICSMLDEGQSPTLDRARVQWNGSEENLNNALDELIHRGILQPILPSANGNSVELNLAFNWRRII